MLSPLRCAAFRYWHICLHPEDHARFVSIRLHREDNALVLLLAQPARLEQWHGGAAVLAGDSTRPEIGHGGFSIDGGIEAFKGGFSFLQDPPAPGTHMPGELGFDRAGLRPAAGTVWLPSRCFLIT